MIKEVYKILNIWENLSGKIMIQKKDSGINGGKDSGSKRSGING